MLAGLTWRMLWVWGHNSCDKTEEHKGCLSTEKLATLEETGDDRFTPVETGNNSMCSLCTHKRHVYIHTTQYTLHSFLSCSQAYHSTVPVHCASYNSYWTTRSCACWSNRHDCCEVCYSHRQPHQEVLAQFLIGRNNLVIPGYLTKAVM